MRNSPLDDHFLSTYHGDNSTFLIRLDDRVIDKLRSEYHGIPR